MGGEHQEKGDTIRKKKKSVETNLEMAELLESGAMSLKQPL